MMKTTGEFEMRDGNLVWKRVEYHPLHDTGCIYLAKKPGDDDHAIYKLQKNEHGAKGATISFTWYGLWNTCVVTGGIDHKTQKRIYRFDTMQEAIIALQEKGYVVKMAFFSDLQRLEYFFE